jgi:predicted RecA/RadA family phage recombinase
VFGCVESRAFATVAAHEAVRSGDLYALGFSTEDINQGLASYGSLMRAQGLQGKQSNEQMVNGAKTYLKELDAMAKITGEERSVKESQMKALAMDAQFQASMAGKSAESRQSFLTTVGKIPGPLQGFVKDFLATGSLTTEETQRIGAMMRSEEHTSELQSLAVS